jgi:hypothetical protein
LHSEASFLGYLSSNPVTALAIVAMLNRTHCGHIRVIKMLGLTFGAGTPTLEDVARARRSHEQNP